MSDHGAEGQPETRQKTTSGGGKKKNKANTDGVHPVSTEENAPKTDKVAKKPSNKKGAKAPAPTEATVSSSSSAANSAASSAASTQQAAVVKPVEPPKADQRLQFCLTSRAGVCQYWALPSELGQAIENSRVPAERAVYTTGGEGLVLMDKTQIVYRNSETCAAVHVLPHPNISKFYISPKASFALTWEHLQPTNAPNMHVITLATGSPVTSFVKKNFPPEQWPLIKWVNGEEICGLSLYDGLQFYAGNFQGGVLNKLSQTGITAWCFSPQYNTSPLCVPFATFVPESKGVPALVSIYKFPFTSNEASSKKSFFKADDCELIWSPDGKALLCRSSTQLDPTGKSYYGQNGLHIMFPNDGSRNATIGLKKEGPIHHASWNPVQPLFCVIYGFMPATITVYRLNGFKYSPVAEFGPAARNAVYWSPDGKVLCLAGFGNLQGEIDFWDTKTFERIGSTVAHCTTSLVWSPDSRYVACATLVPRMRVDNGVKIFTPKGDMIFKLAVPELSDFAWRPYNSLYDIPWNGPISPQPVPTPIPQAVAPSVEKYVPPSASGRGATLHKPGQDETVSVRIFNKPPATTSNTTTTTATTITPAKREPSPPPGYSAYVPKPPRAKPAKAANKTKGKKATTKPKKTKPTKTTNTQPEDE
ncbi:eukaryotic translation initiation factor 2A [Pelomyxa schiedti]|nr:eukaryotic translation initiation factor 2A [Pelomyxa schiedti]